MAHSSIILRVSISADVEQTRLTRAVTKRDALEDIEYSIESSVQDALEDANLSVDYTRVKISVV